MAKPTIPGLFHTHSGTPVQVLYRAGKERLQIIMVKAYPDDNAKSFITHIDLSAIKEPAEEVNKYLDTLNVPKT